MVGSAAAPFGVDCQTHCSCCTLFAYLRAQAILFEFLTMFFLAPQARRGRNLEAGHAPSARRLLPLRAGCIRFHDDELKGTSPRPLGTGLRTLSSPIILQFSSQITRQSLNSFFSVRTQVHSDRTKAHWNDHPLERFACMLGRIYSDG